MSQQPAHKSFSYFKVFFSFFFLLISVIGLAAYKICSGINFTEVRSEVFHIWGDEAARKGKTKQAIFFFKKAIADGHADAANDLGLIYGKKNTPYYDTKLEMYYYQVAADRGNSYGMYNLGLNYSNVNHANKIPTDYKKAVYWYQKSLKTSLDYCPQNDLAILYAKGLGVKQDTKQAKDYFLASAQNFIKRNNDSYELVDDTDKLAKKYADYRIAEVLKQPQVSTKYKQDILIISKQVIKRCWD